MKRSEALKLRSIVEQAVSSLDDQTASTAANLSPKLKENGELVKAGTRINWNGELKRAAADLWDIPEYNPDNSPTLWEDIPYRAGYRIIPNVITVGLKFSKDECGWWGEILYRSKVNNNVFTPEQHPDNWEKEVLN